jgi:hypothetical protein
MSSTEPTGAKWRFESAVRPQRTRLTPTTTAGYKTVVQGQYTLLIDGKEIPLRAGEEYFIPRGLHAFGGHPAERVREP